MFFPSSFPSPDSLRPSGCRHRRLIVSTAVFVPSGRACARSSTCLPCFLYADQLELGGPTSTESTAFFNLCRRSSPSGPPPPYRPGLPERIHELRDPETAADAPVIDYVDDDPPSCLSNQTMEPRIQTPPSTTTPTTLEVPTTTCSPLTTTRSS
ncbi:hypothetical protein ACQJBY_007517 [Aegilops geniculata]